MRELVEATLLQSFTPAAVLVEPDGQILYLHGRTGLYLEPAAGEASVGNVLRMAREGLRGALTVALQQAAATLAKVSVPGLRVQTNGHHTLVDLEVLPLAGPAGATNFLVVLRPSAGQGPALVESLEPGAEPPTELVELRRTLLARDEHLRLAREALEATNEELTAANEELRSLNEELQSANEELETSKEELQSLNEELATINAELTGKVASLSQVNDDLSNLLAGTGIGTLFVDHQLRILRFTPNATQLVHLIAADVGRPLAHVVANLTGYEGLVMETKAVLDTLVPREREVRTPEGRVWSMRIAPYRTLDHVILGAVISFLEITEAVRTREALLRVNDGSRLAAVVRESSDAITLQGFDGRVLSWNRAAEQLFGWSEAEALGLPPLARVPAELHAEAEEELARLARGERLPARATVRLTKDGARLGVIVAATPLLEASGLRLGISTTERPVTAEGSAA